MCFMLMLWWTELNKNARLLVTVVILPKLCIVLRDNTCTMTGGKFSLCTSHEVMYWNIVHLFPKLFAVALHWALQFYLQCGTTGLQRAQNNPFYTSLHLIALATSGSSHQVQDTDACIQNDHRLSTLLLPLTITNLHPLQKSEIC